MATERVNPADLVDQVVDRLVARFKPLRIIIFGSVARGDSRPDSDLDMIVLVPGIGRERYRLEEQAGEAVADLPIERDFHFYTPEEYEQQRYRIYSFIRPAYHEGKVVYDSGYSRYVEEHNVDTSQPDPLDEVRYWVRYAYEDLKMMHVLMRDPDSVDRGVCFHAQQAAEKALKALIIYTGIQPRHTHLLQELLDMVPDDSTVRDIDFSPLIAPKDMSEYARHLRYPSKFPLDATEDVAAACAEAAILVWEAVTADLTRAGVLPDPRPGG